MRLKQTCPLFGILPSRFFISDTLSQDDLSVQARALIALRFIVLHRGHLNRLDVHFKTEFAAQRDGIKILAMKPFVMT